MKVKLLFLLTLLCAISIKAQDTAVFKPSVSKADSVYNFMQQIDLYLYYNLPDSLQRNSFKNLNRKATQFKDDFLFIEAKTHYLSAALTTKKSKKKALAYYESALLFYNQKDFRNATSLFYVVKSLNKNDKKFIEIDYYLGQIAIYNEKYLPAKKLLRDFVKASGDNKNYATLKSNAYLHMRSCNAVLDQDSVNLKEEYALFELPSIINSSLSEYSPNFKENEFVFAREDKTKLSKIYSALALDNGEIETPLFSSAVNFGKSSVANPSFTPDGKTLYFSKCTFKNEAVKDCAIYVSYLKNGIWTSAAKLDVLVNELGSKASYPNISINEKGTQLLFFSAERNRGRGGRDIWYVSIDSLGNTSNLKNAGAPVNSKSDEISPFFNKVSQQLFYSSNGKVSYGGFDVYSATKNGDNFENEQHLAAPVNTSLDDFGFILDQKLNSAYLASNRNETNRTNCCSDIYLLKTLDYSLYIKGDIYAENMTSREELFEADFTLVNLSEGSLKDTSVTDGKYSFVLNKKTDYILQVSNSLFKDVNYSFSTNTYNETDTLYKNIFFKERNIAKPELLAELFYELNKSKLTADAPKSLAYVLLFLENYPDANIEIRAHTDNIGSAAYNLILSEERCKAAINYLVSNGIDRTRIFGSWYGEEKPKESNETAQGRFANRRTEFWIKAD